MHKIRLSDIACHLNSGMLKTILVPYDGSKPSERAIEYAAELGRSVRGEVKILLLQVVPEIYLPPSFDYGMKLPDVKSSREYLKELYQEMKNEAAVMLDRKKQAFGKLDVQTLVLVGHPADMILAAAKDHRADLIVLGSTGLGGISKFKALGSVSRSVSERAPCPVTIVH